jgi:peptidyl-tRNA hydrolase
MNPDTFPVLYILMRTDLPSMNPGKAMAQASHASNYFVHDLSQMKNKDSTISKMGAAWQSSTSRGFGTVLVLGCTKNQMFEAVETAQMLQHQTDTLAGIVLDPTYPYIVDNEMADLIWTDMDTAPRVPTTDGKTVLFRNERTCAYIFGDKNSDFMRLLLDNLKLHP